MIFLLFLLAAPVFGAPYVNEASKQEEQTLVDRMISPFSGMIGPLFRQTSTELEISPPTTPFCYHMGIQYGEGEQIMTTEACLNCTCLNGMLMCYLKVCPFSRPITKGCTIEKKPGDCCPTVTCPMVPVSLQVMQMGSTTLAPPTTQESTALEPVRPGPNVKGCFVDEKFYGDGAMLPIDPDQPCSRCYCIRNQTSCIMQECTLHINQCEPVYVDGVCCPVKYDCEMIMPTTEAATTEPPTTTFISTLIEMVTTPEPPAAKPGCTYNGTFYLDGDVIYTPDPCQHCYCLHTEAVCAIEECKNPADPDIANCTAAEPEPGTCCPKAYNCDTESSPEDTTTVPLTISSKIGEETEEKGSTVSVTEESVTEGQDTIATTESEKITESATKSPEEEDTTLTAETLEKDTESPVTVTSEVTEGPSEKETPSATQSSATDSSNTKLPGEILDMVSSTTIASDTEEEATDKVATTSSDVTDSGTKPISTDAPESESPEASEPSFTEKPDTSAFTVTSTPFSDTTITKEITQAETSPSPTEPDVVSDSSQKEEIDDISTTVSSIEQTSVSQEHKTIDSTLMPTESSADATETPVATQTPDVDTRVSEDPEATTPGSVFGETSTVSQESSSIVIDVTEDPLGLPTGDPTDSGSEDEVTEEPEPSQTEKPSVPLEVTEASQPKTTETPEAITETPVDVATQESSKTTETGDTTTGKELPEEIEEVATEGFVDLIDTTESSVTKGISTDVTDMEASTKIPETEDPTDTEELDKVTDPTVDEVTIEAVDGITTEKSIATTELSEDMKTESPAKGNETSEVDTSDSISPATEDSTPDTTSPVTVDEDSTKTVTTDATLQPEPVDLTTEHMTDVATTDEVTTAKTTPTIQTGSSPATESSSDVTKMETEIPLEGGLEVTTTSSMMEEASQTTTEKSELDITTSSQPLSTDSDDKLTTLPEMEEPKVETRISDPSPEDLTTTPMTHVELTTEESTVTEPDASISEVPGMQAMPAGTDSPTTTTPEGDCFENGELYLNGESIKSSDPCHESCLCLNGTMRCEVISCPLPPPTFRQCIVSRSSSECCESYECPEIENVIGEESCVVDNVTYPDGAHLENDDVCIDCYCVRGKVVCATLECHVPAGNCYPSEHRATSCCPSKYICDQDQQETTPSIVDTTPTVEDVTTKVEEIAKPTDGSSETVPEVVTEDLIVKTTLAPDTDSEASTTGSELGPDEITDSTEKSTSMTEIQPEPVSLTSTTETPQTEETSEVAKERVTVEPIIEEDISTTVPSKEKLPSGELTTEEGDSFATDKPDSEADSTEPTPSVELTTEEDRLIDPESTTLKMASEEKEATEPSVTDPETTFSTPRPTISETSPESKEPFDTTLAPDIEIEVTASKKPDGLEEESTVSGVTDEPEDELSQTTLSPQETPDTTTEPSFDKVTIASQKPEGVEEESTVAGVTGEEDDISQTTLSPQEAPDGTTEPSFDKSTIASKKPEGVEEESTVSGTTDGEDEITQTTLSPQETPDGTTEALSETVSITSEKPEGIKEESTVSPVTDESEDDLSKTTVSPQEIVDPTEPLIETMFTSEAPDGVKKESTVSPVTDDSDDGLSGTTISPQETVDLTTDPLVDIISTTSEKPDGSKEESTIAAATGQPEDALTKTTLSPNEAAEVTTESTSEHLDTTGSSEEVVVTTSKPKLTEGMDSVVTDLPVVDITDPSTMSDTTVETVKLTTPAQEEATDSSDIFDGNATQKTTAVTVEDKEMTETEISTLEMTTAKVFPDIEGAIDVTTTPDEEAPSKIPDDFSSVTDASVTTEVPIQQTSRPLEEVSTDQPFIGTSTETDQGTSVASVTTLSADKTETTQSPVKTTSAGEVPETDSLDATTETSSQTDDPTAEKEEVVTTPATLEEDSTSGGEETPGSPTEKPSAATTAPSIPTDVFNTTDSDLEEPASTKSPTETQTDDSKGEEMITMEPITMGASSTENPEDELPVTDISVQTESGSIPHSTEKAIEATTVDKTISVTEPLVDEATTDPEEPVSGTPEITATEQPSLSTTTKTPKVTDSSVSETSTTSPLASTDAADKEVTESPITGDTLEPVTETDEDIEASPKPLPEIDSTKAPSDTDSVEGKGTEVPFTGSTATPSLEETTVLTETSSLDCQFNGTLYFDNEPIPPLPCEDSCKCENGTVKCIRSACKSPPVVQNCTTVIREGECCPKYDCTTETPLEKTYCAKDNQLFEHGATVQSDDICTLCQCLHGEIVCAILECVPPSSNCTALRTASNECCPDKYECETPSETMAVTTESYVEDLTTEQIEAVTEPIEVMVVTEASTVKPIVPEPIAITEDTGEVDATPESVTVPLESGSQVKESTTPSDLSMPATTEDAAVVEKEITSSPGEETDLEASTPVPKDTPTTTSTMKLTTETELEEGTTDKFVSVTPSSQQTGTSSAFETTQPPKEIEEVTQKVETPITTETQDVATVEATTLSTVQEATTDVDEAHVATDVPQTSSQESTDDPLDVTKTPDSVTSEPAITLDPKIGQVSQTTLPPASVEVDVTTIGIEIEPTQTDDKIPEVAHTTVGTPEDSTATGLFEVSTVSELEGSIDETEKSTDEPTTEDSETMVVDPMTVTEDPTGKETDQEVVETTESDVTTDDSDLHDTVTSSPTSSTDGPLGTTKTPIDAIDEQATTVALPSEKPEDILNTTQISVQTPEAAVETTETPSEITEASEGTTMASDVQTGKPVDITTDTIAITEPTPEDVTEAAVEVTKSPFKESNATQTEDSVSITMDPTSLSEASENTTNIPVNTTDPSVDIPESTVDPKESLIEVTEAPIDITPDSVATTLVPIDITGASEVSTLSPVGVTKIEVETTEISVTEKEDVEATTASPHEDTDEVTHTPVDETVEVDTVDTPVDTTRGPLEVSKVPDATGVPDVEATTEIPHEDTDEVTHTPVDETVEVDTVDTPVDTTKDPIEVSEVPDATGAPDVTGVPETTSISDVTDTPDSEDKVPEIFTDAPAAVTEPEKEVTESTDDGKTTSKPVATSEVTDHATEEPESFTVVSELAITVTETAEAVTSDEAIETAVKTTTTSTSEIDGSVSSTDSATDFTESPVKSTDSPVETITATEDTIDKTDASIPASTESVEPAESSTKLQTGLESVTDGPEESLITTEEVETETEYLPAITEAPEIPSKIQTDSVTEKMPHTTPTPSPATSETLPTEESLLEVLGTTVVPEGTEKPITIPTVLPEVILPGVTDPTPDLESDATTAGPVTTFSSEDKEATTSQPLPEEPPKLSCIYFGKEYQHKEPIKRASECEETCFCNNGTRTCYLKSCPTPPSRTMNCVSVSIAGECCPSYSCEPEATIPGEGCVLNNTLYNHNEAVPTDSICADCRCANGNIVCAHLECQVPRANCIPVVHRSDECCPSEYECTDSTEPVTMDILSVIKETTPAPAETVTSPDDVATKTPTDEELATTTKIDTQASSTSKPKVDETTVKVEEEVTLPEDSTKTPAVTKDDTKDTPSLFEVTDKVTVTTPLPEEKISTRIQPEEDSTDKTPIEDETTTVESIEESIATEKIQEVESLTEGVPQGETTTISDAEATTPQSFTTMNATEDETQPEGVEPKIPTTDTTTQKSTDADTTTKTSTTVDALYTTPDNTTDSPLFPPFPGSVSSTTESEPFPPFPGSGSSTTEPTPVPPYPGNVSSTTEPPPFPPYPGSVSSTTESPTALSPGACLFDGKVYVSAQQIPRDNPCDFCFCFRGDIICLQQSCPPPIPGCYEEGIPGFCCPRYECPAKKMMMNATTTEAPVGQFQQQSIDKTSRLAACEIGGKFYDVGEEVQEANTPCLSCKCGEAGYLDCLPLDCGLGYRVRRYTDFKLR